MKISIALAVFVLLGATAVFCMPNPEEEENVDIGEPDINDDADDGDNNDDADDGDNDRKKRAIWSTVPGTSGGEGASAPPSGTYFKAGGCTAKYKALGSSTMCKYKDSPDVTLWGCTGSEKNQIISYHNNIRGKEGAADMLKVYWCDKIAEIAQKLAQSCKYEHDTYKGRMVPEYGHGAGQNLCKGTGQVQTCLKMWSDEKKYWSFGARNSLGKVGHFTQMVTAKTVRIGCGHAYCNNGIGHLWVCNYSYAQNTGDVNTPYARGKACSECGGRCSIGVCDCGNKYCNNGGTLVSATCKCKCASGFSGATCT